jgi:hypothetical protein
VKGYRTFVAGLVGILALVIGLKLVDVGQRHTAYVFFASGIVGIITALFAKSVGTAAVGGEGLKGGVANLMTSSKPKEG